ncbi:proteasome maturation factor ump1 protein [Babesia caballi]|uniref:Proteasome maturation factor ump1 protein n=1 Tax=Babesia caballi TaxID=5871 RepID=A0AAV4LNQ6_BABCB|nr:proteasome maturation factor ump1 protein [Babesia caballi]
MEVPGNLATLNVDLNNFPHSSLDGSGVRTAFGDMNAAHPMEDIDYKDVLKQEMAKAQRLQKALGYQATLKNSIELNTCANSTRLPGIKSSMLSVEILMDKLDSLEPYEYMNVEKPRHDFGVGGVHSLLEDKFNI